MKNNSKSFEYWLRELHYAKPKMENIKNVIAHWLYGTRPEYLAKLSRNGIVYNPPGFNGGR